MRCYARLRQVSFVWLMRDVCARGCAYAELCYFRV
jgi:hypothetical protein